ncbi:MAG: two pore domain potassium channel family protein [Xanthobacteraceae bacterium]|nr:two pore domain potassium channel family protein [Xanthobacteraceae bacterium]MBX3523816.1 two pore domain potassium channel family protein [Xanthobacteraceae bacterium]MBX3532735.1 two pore domain potassium channel family protein [Xanthobacteraceae bacterium]MBX3549473.1 two pore domain potassium channel family protein [Xanthobacteraceae bacterium]MCW5673171.1 two pore domain potassium channel family protein [Xanthobacteraceae bacterium]
MILNLSLSVVMTAIVVAVHLVGIFLLLFFLRRNAHRVEGQGAPSLVRQGALMLGVVLGIFLLHTVEVWLYAIAYMVLGAFDHFPTALYFSATAFSTLGFGDVILNHDWRLFGSVEGVTGLILIGWSSAFLLSVTSRLRILEHNWEAYAKGRPKRKRK